MTENDIENLSTEEIQLFNALTHTTKRQREKLVKALEKTQKENPGDTTPKTLIQLIQFLESLTEEQRNAINRETSLMLRKAGDDLYDVNIPEGK